MSNGRADSPGLFAKDRTTREGSAGEWISAHCDGGARGNPGPAGYGALIQGSNGEVIAELSEFLGSRTNNYAEYSGLLGCLAWALEHGHRRLRLVSDSELMVKQIQGKYQVKSPDLKPLYDEAKRRIARLDGFEITHALRHKNKDADRLANEAMDRGTRRDTDFDTARGMHRGPEGSAPKAALSSASTLTGPARPPVLPRAAKPVRKPDAPATAAETRQTMLRGFTRDGVVHVLGGVKLPDGVFVKIILE